MVSSATARQSVAFVVPRRVAQREGRELHVGREDVRAGRREARIEQRRDRELDVRLR